MQHAALDRCTDGNNFIRVHALVRLAAEEFLHGFLNRRHAGHAAHENDFVDVGRRLASICERFLARFDGALDEVFDKAFELGARQLDIEVLGAGRICRDEGKVHFILAGRGKLFLGFLGFFLESLKGKLVGFQVNALILLELFCKEVDDPEVEVFTAEERVTIGGQHFEHTVADFEQGDVERTTAKVVDCDRLGLFVLVEAVGEGRSGWLVDDPQDFKTRDLAGVFGCLALRIIEVGRHGDDRLGHFAAEIGFSRFLHLGQDESRHFLWCVILVATFDPGVACRAFDDFERGNFLVLLRGRVVELATDQTLDGVEGEIRVGDSLAPGRHADQAFAAFSEGHNGRGCALAFCVFNDLCLSAFHDGDAGVGGSKVNTNDFAHVASLFLSSRHGPCSVAVCSAAPDSQWLFPRVQMRRRKRF